ncbi:cyclin-A1 [Rana temporaria]|uniref:cyclin-A1 n=1 Tax=Rana temporaria TaxID=8407 RepID=UPI001AAD897A|nr:cyclin-A1 [Rana temporaria]
MRRTKSSSQVVANAGMGSFDIHHHNIAQQRVPTNTMPQRSILGVLSENEQRHRSHSVSALPTKMISGFENAFPFPGKMVSTKAAAVLSKPCFAIYIDEPEIVQETYQFEVELPSLEEMDANVVKEKFTLLLDGSAASPMMVDSTLPPDDDATETDPDVIAVSEYIDEIYLYLRQAEVKHRPKPYYMRKQPDITSAMRAILVDWLVEVREEYKLRNETLYLAVNYLDRFLSSMSVLRGKLQLVGTAAILLAAKYEEIYPPDLDEFVYITDDTYTKQQLLRMEHLLLKVLAFDLTVPTINQFLLQYIHKQAVGTKAEHLAMYMAELTLLEVDPFLKYVPSLTAAAAYCLANYTINRIFWPGTLQAFTGYTLSDIAPCLVDLHRACLNAPHQSQKAIWEKYKAPKYMQVSHLAIPATLPL